MTDQLDSGASFSVSSAPRVLVTGAAGALGSALMRVFLARGVAAVGLTRHGLPPVTGDAQWRQGDLLMADSLGPALQGIDVVVHCATKSGHAGEDVAALGNLLALGGGLSHLIYVGIAGIEDAASTFHYYQAKLDCEARLGQSGVPHTIVRATQFHEFVAYILGSYRKGRIQLLPVMRVQPVETEYVAARLADYAVGAPQMRAPDIHGPERLSAYQLFAQWSEARGSHLVPIPLPGVGRAGLFGRLRTVRGDVGGRTWRAWLALHARD